jgi:hypothetical protein
MFCGLGKCKEFIFGEIGVVGRRGVYFLFFSFRFSRYNYQPSTVCDQSGLV